MRNRRCITIIYVLAALGACGDGSGSNDSGASSGSSGPGGNSTGDPSDSEPTGGDPTGDATQGSDAETSGTESGDPTGGTESHRICDLYLNCLAVIAPTELPGAQQGFGPDGTCWQGDEDSAQQCIAACQAGLATWHESDPSEPACWLCQAPGDCPEGQTCEAGECTPGEVHECGDGVVDPDEVCDGSAGCDADCQGPAECSPWTLAGCEADEVCLAQAMADPTCKPGDAGLPKLGEVCDPDAFEVCAEGTICAPSGFALDCPDPGCCIGFCDSSLDAPLCPNGGGCQPNNFNLIPTPGLGYLGFCI